MTHAHIKHNPDRNSCGAIDSILHVGDYHTRPMKGYIFLLDSIVYNALEYEA